MGAFEQQSGKVSERLFKEEIFGRCGAPRKEVLQGPSFGVDTSVVDIGAGNVLCISSDPLSLIPSMGMKVSAWLSVHLLVNDMCTTGYMPQYAQFVLNLPTDLTRADFQGYWGFIHQMCDNLDIAITGGHTGQIPGQNSTISGGGTMFLTAPKEQVLVSSGAKPGDRIILTKHAALSSTALLARAFPKTLETQLGKSLQKDVSDRLWDLSVVKESQIARSVLKPNSELNAMHDVTEGGVLGACSEMASASNLGFEVDVDKIPIPPSVKAVAEFFEIDPLYSIGAGSMIMSVNPDAEARLLEALKREGILATGIGTFTSNSNCMIRQNGEVGRMVFDGEDPYWSAFFNAFAKEWK